MARRTRASLRMRFQTRKSFPDLVPRFLIHFRIAYRYQERLFLMIIVTA